MYSIFNEYSVSETILHKLGKYEDQINLIASKKNHIDEIIATYPFMFPPDVIEFWKKNIQNIEPYNIPRVSPVVERSFYIPKEFRDIINEEYNKRVKKYHSLLGL